MNTIDAMRLPLYGLGGELIAHTLVDATDYQWLTQWRWAALRCKGKLAYACRSVCVSGKWGKVLLHRELLTPAEGLVVDHINHDGLDNRRCNLRLATLAENAYNRKMTLSNHMTGYKGVRITANGRFVAQAKLSGRYVYIGIYDDAVSAALAYDHAARRLFGWFAYTNFEEGYRPPESITPFLVLPHQGVHAPLPSPARRQQAKRTKREKALPASLFDF